MTVLTSPKSRVFPEEAFSWGFAPIMILVAVHFLFLACFFAPAISTPDANGYMAQARLIARQGRTDFEVETPAQYVGDHWMAVAEGRFYGQYPPGLPALLAVVFRPFGWYPTLWVIPVLGSLSLLGLYLVVREWVGPGWALLAAGLMAVNPFANQHALGADSHTAVCFFLIWALHGLIRWERSRSPGWAAVVGLCLGLIPTIRYAESLFLIPFGVYVAFSPPRDGRWWRSVLAALGCASVPLVALAVRNQEAFGAFWRTGYSVSGEQTGFGLGYFVRHAIPYLLMLLIMGVALVFPLGVKGMVELCKRPETRRRGYLLAGLVLPITLLYMAYYWGADPNSMRFLLPTYALYTIAAVWLLQLRSETEPERARKWVKILLGVTLLWGLPYSVFALHRLKRENMAIAEVTRVVEDHVEPGSVLIAQSGLLQHLDYRGDWRLAPAEAFDRQARPLGPRGPGADRKSRPEDGLTPAERTRSFRRDLARWAGDARKVYLLTTEAELKAVQDRLNPSEDEFTTIAEIKVAVRPGPPPPRFRGGPPGPGAGPPFQGRGGPPPWGGPPPGGRGFPGPPAHFEPPEDGKFVLVRWTMHPENAEFGMGNGEWGRKDGGSVPRRQRSIPRAAMVRPGEVWPIRETRHGIQR